MTAPPSPDPLAQLLRRLRAVGATPAAREVAEALWLARYVTTAETGPGEDVPATRPQEPDRPGALRSPAVTAPTPPTDSPREPEGPASRPARLYADAPGLPPPGDDDTPPVRVRTPAAPALPGPLPLLRALRPLRHYRPPVRTPAEDFDEQATAEQAAQTGLLLPVLRPAVRREARLQLLMDASSSTPVWDRTLEELHHLCTSLGTFRDVAVHYLHPGPGDALLAGPGRGTHALAPVAQLRDPTGRLLTLLVSDCAGPLWQDGRIQRLLRDWTRAAPVALVQPLPQRMWHETHLPALPGTLCRGEGLGHRLKFTPAEDDRPPDAVPVLVLGPTRSGFATWARLLSGRTGLSFPAAAAWALPGPSALDPLPAPETLDPDQLVDEFRSSASRAAQSLVRALSAVPLTLEVMQLVQRVVLPESGPSVLAEVLLGGLLRQGPQDGWYEFLPGVREELLRALPLGEAALVLRQCGTYVARHFGRRARNFPALALERLTGLPEGQEGGEVPDELRPFAEVSQAVVRRYRQSRARTQTAAETFVIVYAGFDQAWTTWLASVLEERGHRAALLRWREGDLGQLLADALEANGRVLLLLSDWFLFQLAAPDLQDHVRLLGEFVAGADGRIITFHIGEELAPGAEFFRPVHLSGMSETATRTLILGRLGVSPDAPPKADRRAPGFPGRDPGPAGVPRRNPGMTWREELLDRLRDMLFRGEDQTTVCALIGERGSGKTQLAAEYVHRYHNEYGVVRWIDADAPLPDVRRRFAEVAGLRGVRWRYEPLSEQIRVADEALRQGRTPRPWLFVFDGWSDIRGATDLLPVQGPGHVVVTSRDDAWSSLATALRVDPQGGGDPGLDEDLVGRSMVRISALAGGDEPLRGRGFFVAPGLVLTTAQVVNPSSSEELEPVAITTADGDRFRSLWVHEAGDLALVRLQPQPRDAECVWLSDRPTVMPGQVVVHGAVDVSPSGLDGRLVGEVFGLGGDDLGLLGVPVTPGTYGSPVLDPRRACVIGVVKEPGAGDEHRGRVVPVSALSTDRVWHEVVVAHDRHHWHRFREPARTWTVVQERRLRDSGLYSDFTPEWRVELYGILAELPPPDSPDRVLALVPGRVRVLVYLPHCWRDGVGLVREEGGGLGEVALYAARIWTGLGGVLRGTQLRDWAFRAVEALPEDQGGLREEILAVLQLQVAPFPLEPSRYVLLGIEPRMYGDRHSWIVQLVDGGEVVPVAADDRGVVAAELVQSLAEPLSRAFSYADTHDRPAPLLCRLPYSLSDLPVERWSLEGAEPPLGWQRPVAVCMRNRDRPMRSNWLARWRAVQADGCQWWRLNDVADSLAVLDARLGNAPKTAVPYFCRHGLPDQDVAGALRLMVDWGYPVALWSRATDHRRCRLFEREAAALLADLRTPRELLEHLHQARLSANISGEASGPQWTDEISLLYDDPDLSPPPEPLRAPPLNP